MKVVNVVGHTYGFLYMGRVIAIPADGREWTLPDDVDVNQFGRNLRITVPKKPVIVSAVIPIEEPKSQASTIVINIDEITNTAIEAPQESISHEQASVSTDVIDAPVEPPIDEQTTTDVADVAPIVEKLVKQPKKTVTVNKKSF